MAVDAMQFFLCCMLLADVVTLSRLVNVGYAGDCGHARYDAATRGYALVYDLDSEAA